ncbi:MAG: LolA family protein [Flavobacteriales bacterium Tduv]
MFSLFISIPITAQSKKESETLLDKTYETIRNLGKLILNFTYRWDYYPEEKTQSVKNGILYLSKEKYRLEVMDIIQICDGYKIYTISTKDKEITVSDTKSNENLLYQIQIFSIYRKNFTPKKAELKKIGKKNIQFINLEPKEKNSGDLLSVGIDVSNYKLYQVIEKGRDITTTITIRKQIPWTNAGGTTLLKFDQKNYPNYMITKLD